MRMSHQGRSREFFLRDVGVQPAFVCVRACVPMGAVYYTCKVGNFRGVEGG